MATTVTLKPNAIDISGSTSGTTTLQASAVAGTTTVTLPATTGTVITTGDTGTVTNTMLAGSIANAKLSNSSVTIGGTSISLGSSSSSITNDLTISGLTVGKGGGSVSTNTAVGSGVLAGANTGVGYNTAVGYASLAANTSGTNNTGIGNSALNANTTGADNQAFGTTALYLNTTGSSNTAVGRDSLRSNTTASNNTAVGYQAGYSITTGEPNVFIGKGAGYTTTASTTATNCIYIGADSRGSANNNNAEIVLGCATSGKGSNTAFISPGGGAAYQGNNSSSWSTTSDRRLKKNIVDNTEGLNIISQIRVRNFEYRTAEEVTELPPHSIIDKQGVQLGVIAQELQEVCSDCVKEESTGVLSVDSSNITWHMINAIKDLKALVDAQATLISGQAAEIAELKAKVA